MVHSEIGEACDLGAEVNNDNSACLSDCTEASCGDGHTWLGVEECDLEDDNQDGVYGGCTPTCSLGPHCGDAVLQPSHEECDLGKANGMPGAPCTGQCKFAGRLVFATSTTYTGAIGLGGVDGADDACNAVAMEAGLANAGNFRAWISDSEMSPSKWEPHPQGPFILPNATIIAQTWYDLLDGSLTVGIDIDETGEMISEKPQFVWTGTGPDGNALPETCAGWTDGTKNKLGMRGSLLSTGAEWTELEVTQCWKVSRLVCIEQ